jgi:hypothetical protein
MANSRLQGFRKGSEKDYERNITRLHFSVGYYKGRKERKKEKKEKRQRKIEKRRRRKNNGDAGLKRPKEEPTKVR